jgi:hypothetical protein
VLPGTALQLASTTAVSGNPISVAMADRYALVVDEGGDNLWVYDLANEASPRRLSSIATAGANPYDVAVAWPLAFVASQGSLDIFDVGNPALPVLRSQTPFVGGGARGIAVQGRYAYIANYSGGSFLIYDIANPDRPVLAGSVSGLTSPHGVAVQGAYAYVVDLLGSSLSIIDIKDPTRPFVARTVPVAEGPARVAVQGSYAYTASYASGSQVNIVDISSVTSASVVATTTLSSGPYNVSVSGRYAYVALSSGGVAVLDVSSPTSPYLVTQRDDLGSGTRGIAVSGKTLVATDWGSGRIHAFRIPGYETSSLVAHAGQLGSLSVRSPVNIFSGLRIGGGLMVGFSGLSTLGAISSAATGTTSTFLGYVSSTGAEFSSFLRLRGQNICLSDGTNCPAVSGTTWVVDDAAGTVYPYNTSRDVLLGSTNTSSAPFLFDKGQGTSTLFVANGTNTNILVGTSTYTGVQFNGFGLGGNDMLVQGSVGSVEGLFAGALLRAGSRTELSSYTVDAFQASSTGQYRFMQDGRSAWRFMNGASEDFTVSSGGNIGIGVSNPSQVLDVAGDIKDLVTNVPLSLVTSSAPQMTVAYAYPAKRDDYLFFANDEIFLTYRVADDGRTTFVASTTLGITAAEAAFSMVVAEGYAYVVSDNGGGTVSVIDISDPANPQLVGKALNISSSGFVSKAIAYASGHLFVGMGNGFNGVITVDVRNPKSPRVVQRKTLTSAFCSIATMEIAGEYLFTTCSGLLQSSRIQPFGQGLGGEQVAADVAVEGHDLAAGTEGELEGALGLSVTGELDGQQAGVGDVPDVVKREACRIG